MLLVILGFLLVTSLAFGIPFLMGGNDKAVAAQRGITLAVVASILYVGAVFVLRG
ncbi:MAG: hypothetical protein AAFN43_04175 [Pseudomonadota bacterium]